MPLRATAGVVVEKMFTKSHRRLRRDQTSASECEATCGL